MSDLFKQKPNYYEFIRTLEFENEQYRNLRNQCTKLSAQNNQEFRESLTAAIHTIKSENARKPRVITKKTKPTFYSISFDSRVKPEKVDELNSPAISTSFPIRPSSAKRIFRPKRDIECSFSEHRPSPPLIHSTGVNSSVIVQKSSKTKYLPKKKIIQPS